jgi:hypothetical protein
MTHQTDLLREQIAHLKEALASNPSGGLAPAIQRQVDWLEQKLAKIEHDSTDRSS